MFGEENLLKVLTFPLPVECAHSVQAKCTCSTLKPPV